MRVGDILQQKQPDVAKQLQRKSHKRRKRRRGKKKESLSFSYIDRLMRTNKGIDETKCRGR